MIITVAATLVHLGTITTTALWTRWKGTEQVLEEDHVPEVCFQPRASRMRRASGTAARGSQAFRSIRKKPGPPPGPGCDLFDPQAPYQGGGGGDAGQKAGPTLVSTTGPRPGADEGEDYTTMINATSRGIISRRLAERGPDARVNVLVLMSDTGGGHRASAQALEAAFDILYPGRVSVKVVDVLTEHMAWPMNESVAAYQYAAKNPLVWRVMYESQRFPPTRWANDQLIGMFNFKSVAAAVRGYDPDLVLSVHPLCQTLPLRVLRSLGPEGRRALPFVTVITDLGGAHPTWFDPTADKVFVASDAVMRVAFRNGVHARRIHQLGLPIRPAFWRDSRPKPELRRELGLDLEAPAVMVVGGGDGVGGLAQVAAAMIRRLGAAARDGYPTQLVVICGKNEAVKRDLEAMHVEKGLNCKILGFVRNMDEWMGAVDVIVTKAGPGTIAEATIRGLPIMLMGYLPGQEEGNVPFVVNGGFGAFSKNPRRIADTVAGWLLDPPLLATMSAAARRAARPTATFDIAREIGDMLFEAPTGGLESGGAGASAVERK